MNLLCILARAPSPGTGKTRIRAGLGDAVTDRLTRAFLDDVLDWSTDAVDAVLVAHDGPAHLLSTERRPRRIVAQVEGDLGDRIAAAVDAGFEAGASRVVIVGSDCPTLPARLLELAFEGLSSAASTLVPARDGGWIALGVDRPLGATLAGVTWSSILTASQTIAALRADGRPPRVLPPWYDIDEPADLERLRRDPVGPVRAPRTHAVLSALLTPTR